MLTRSSPTYALRTYTGRRATGAVIGMPIKQYIIRDLWSVCLSVPNFFKTSVTVFSGINVDGNDTSTASFPDSSSAFRRAERGGIDFSPHSSYGILLSAAFPYSTTFFCQPDSFFSQFAHRFAALVVLLSSKLCFSVVAMFSR